jgi:HSP20 family molecular chaperone IbpA
MIFDQTWIADLLELQKKASELTKGKNPTEEVQGLVMDVLNNWGINDFPWNGDLESKKSFWTNSNVEPKTKRNLNFDISETKDYIHIQASIPGIEDKNDLAIKLHGDTLYITGKSNIFDNDGGSFNRKIRLPAETTALGAEATYHDDTLTISLPKMTTEGGETIPLNFSQTK